MSIFGCEIRRESRNGYAGKSIIKIGMFGLSIFRESIGPDVAMKLSRLKAGNGDAFTSDRAYR